MNNTIKQWDSDFIIHAITYNSSSLQDLKMKRFK